MEDAVFYTPTDNGYEKQMGDYLEFLRDFPAKNKNGRFPHTLV